MDFVGAATDTIRWWGYLILRMFFSFIDSMFGALNDVFMGQFLNTPALNDLVHKFGYLQYPMLLCAISFFAVSKIWFPQLLITIPGRVLKVVLFTDLIYIAISKYSVIVSGFNQTLKKVFGFSITDNPMSNKILSQLVYDNKNNTNYLSAFDFQTASSYNEKITVNSQEIYRFTLDFIPGLFIVFAMFFCLIIIGIKSVKHNLEWWVKAIWIPAMLWASVVYKDDRSGAYTDEMVKSFLGVLASLFSIYFYLFIVTNMASLNVFAQIIVYLGIAVFILDGSDFLQQTTGQDVGMNGREALVTAVATSRAMKPVSTFGRNIGRAVSNGFGSTKGFTNRNNDDKGAENITRNNNVKAVNSPNERTNENKKLNDEMRTNGANTNNIEQKENMRKQNENEKVKSDVSRSQAVDTRGTKNATNEGEKLSRNGTNTLGANSEKANNKNIEQTRTNANTSTSPINGNTRENVDFENSKTSSRSNDVPYNNLSNIESEQSHQSTKDVDSISSDYSKVRQSSSQSSQLNSQNQTVPQRKSPFAFNTNDRVIPNYQTRQNIKIEKNPIDTETQPKTSFRKKRK